MIINKVDFNRDWACGVSEREFISTFHRIHWQELTDSERTKKLKEAYKLLNNTVPVKDTAEVTEGEQPVE
jgi:hypothetical protein